MGQYWKVYNLDKRQVLEFGGAKLGEWFFSNDSTRFLTLLKTDHDDSWSDNRVICFGDYADVNDLPKGLVTDEELAELGYKKETVERSRWNLFGGAVEIWQPEDVYYHLEKHFTRVSNPRVGKEDYTPYVLRNLSKKEYIHGDEAKTKKGITLLGFCLFSKICWSSDPSASMKAGSIPLTAGPWAGDRFDVVLADGVKDVLASDGWKDVTKRAKEDVVDLFSSNGFSS